MSRSSHPAAKKLDDRRIAQRWRIIACFKWGLWTIALFSLASLLFLIGFAVVATIKARAHPNTLFLIDAQTDRLSFDVPGAGGSLDSPNKETVGLLQGNSQEFWVSGVKIVVENRKVIQADRDGRAGSNEDRSDDASSEEDESDDASSEEDESDDAGSQEDGGENVGFQEDGSGPAGTEDIVRYDAECVEGWIEPGAFARLEMMVVDGFQRLRIEGGAPTVLSNARVKYILEPDNSSDQDGDAKAAELPDMMNPNVSDNKDTTQNDGGATRINIVGLNMTGVIQIADDPDCSESAAFAPRNDPIFFHGAAQIGRQTRAIDCGLTDTRCNGAEGALSQPQRPAFITGGIDLMARKTFCWSWPILQPCTDVYKVAPDEIPIPVGASLSGGTRRGDGKATAMIGQVFFDGALYNVRASTNANWISMSFPDQLTGTLSESRLKLTLFDHLFANAWIAIILAFFLTSLGWVLSILQIELDAIPDNMRERERGRDAPLDDAPVPDGATEAAGSAAPEEGEAPAGR